MSKHDEAYIEKFQPKMVLVTDCHLAEVYPGRTPGSMYDPPQPYYVCAECGSRCDVLTLTEEEIDH